MSKSFLARFLLLYSTFLSSASLSFFTSSYTLHFSFFFLFLLLLFDLLGVFRLRDTSLSHVLTKLI